MTLPRGTPIVFLSIDTLRSDRLPAYGYRGVATPAIDRLTREGVRFENAYAHVPLTLPSHSSVMSGLLPGEHGIRDNVGYVLDRKHIAAGELPWLPKRLKDKGYATGAGVSAFVLRGKTGFAEGFDFYEDGIEFRSGTGLGGLQRPGLETLRLVTPWLDSVAGKPFFLFFHLYEPHTPHAAPSPFAERYADPYDAEVAAADQVVGELVAQLERLGVWDRALVMLFSDHGEGLGDHGEEEHGVLLYREAIQVPLIVKLPGGRLAGSVAKAPAQLADLAPTVLQLLGETPPPAMKGANLLALLGDDAPARRLLAETWYPRLHFGWSELASLVDGRFHYLDGPTPELFDLATDPAERTSVLEGERRTFAEMRRELDAYDLTLTPPGAVDEESRQALAALGYVGSIAVPADGNLPDPRSQLPTLKALKEGLAHFAKGEDAAAVAAFHRVLAGSPNMTDALEYLGRAHERLGDSGAALTAYQKALEVSGGAPHVAIAAASLLLEQGRLKEAEDHARLALGAHPSFAHGVLSQVALARKDLAAAEREARAAIEGGENRLGPLIILAAVQQEQGRFEEVLATVAQADEVYAARKAKEPELLRGLNLTRGKALADLGRMPEAEAAFRSEIELFPKDPRAYSSLAILAALTGRPHEVPALLRTMVESRPTPATYAEAVRTLRILGDGRSAQSLLAFARQRFPGSRELVGL
ncbi:MAG TPA: sulfatase-like hydrolase/transferase [Thermoanaerobaculia bacterium]|nr:sulfatase-like hydrolase/transferase [Thermoanaerobaculia bacterium]